MSFIVPQSSQASSHCSYDWCSHGREIYTVTATLNQLLNPTGILSAILSRFIIFSIFKRKKRELNIPRSLSCTLRPRSLNWSLLKLFSQCRSVDSSALRSNDSITWARYQLNPHPKKNFRQPNLATYLGIARSRYFFFQLLFSPLPHWLFIYSFI